MSDDTIRLLVALLSWLLCVSLFGFFPVLATSIIMVSAIVLADRILIDS
jgi:hypothetical protein